MVSLSLCAPRRLRKQGLHIDVSTSGEDEDYHAAEDAYGHFPCDALDHSNATEDGLTHAPNLKDDDDFVFSPSPAIKTARALGLQDRGEGEGRAAYSQVAGNFDLGGFKIGASGLVSSPRNRGRRRPSLNEGDNFVILARLGSGSSSSVHKALHLPTMRLVALKSLPLYDAERRAQLMRELRVLYSNLASINSSRKGRGGQRNDREAALHEGAADNTTENTGAWTLLIDMHANSASPRLTSQPPFTLVCSGSLSTCLLKVPSNTIPHSHADSIVLFGGCSGPRGGRRRRLLPLHRILL
jgi:hypothetical protein